MFTNYKNAKIHYTLQGKGKKIVLLHGYLESLEVWTELAKELAKQFEVLCIDLLGQGRSEIAEPVSSMELQADMVAHVMQEQNFDKAIVIAHSMGGYSLLAFLEKYPEMLTAFSLFHSHPFADTEVTKENRTREIELIKAGKKDLLISTSIPNMFAEKNRIKYSKEITEIADTAVEFSNEGIIAALSGMRIRPDRNELLSKTEIPFLYIWGKEDKFVPKEIFDRIKMPKNTELLILENSGHLGFVEEKEKALNKIVEWIELNNES